MAKLLDGLMSTVERMDVAKKMENITNTIGLLAALMLGVSLTTLNTIPMDDLLMGDYRKMLRHSTYGFREYVAEELARQGFDFIFTLRDGAQFDVRQALLHGNLVCSAKGDPMEPGCPDLETVFHLTRDVFPMKLVAAFAYQTDWGIRTWEPGRANFRYGMPYSSQLAYLNSRATNGLLFCLFFVTIYQVLSNMLTIDESSRGQAAFLLLLMLPALVWSCYCLVSAVFYICWAYIFVQNINYPFWNGYTVWWIYAGNETSLIMVFSVITYVVLSFGILFWAPRCCKRCCKRRGDSPGIQGIEVQLPAEASQTSSA